MSPSAAQPLLALSHQLDVRILHSDQPAFTFSADDEDISDQVEDSGKVELTSRPIRSSKDAVKSPKRSSVRIWLW